MKLKKITLAVNDLDAMARFYERLLDVTFDDLKLYNSLVKTSTYQQINIMLCPNIVAQVQADQARHQFEFEVHSLNDIRNDEFIKSYIDMEMSNETFITLIDPDRNTLVLTQQK